MVYTPPPHVFPTNRHRFGLELWIFPSELNYFQWNFPCTSGPATTAVVVNWIKDGKLFFNWLKMSAIVKSFVVINRFSQTWASLIIPVFLVNFSTIFQVSRTQNRSCYRKTSTKWVGLSGDCEASGILEWTAAGWGGRGLVGEQDDLWASRLMSS